MISKLQTNRVRRSYLGGARIDSFCNVNPQLSTADPQLLTPNSQLPTLNSPRGAQPRPEDWLASTTQAFNGTLEVEGEGLGRLEDGRLVRDAVGALPILVKLLDSDERLVVQAHPTVPCARRLFNSPVGKTECWYFLPGTAPDACVYLGFKPGMTREAWEKAVMSPSSAGDITSFLHRIPVAPGDFVFVDGGVPHAIGGGCFMIELQEPSDLMVVAERFTPSGRRIPDAKMHGGVGWEKMFEVYEYEGRTYEETVAKYVRKCPQAFNDHKSSLSTSDTNVNVNPANPVNPVKTTLCGSAPPREKANRICGPEFTDKFEMWRVAGGGAVALDGASAVAVVTEGQGMLGGEAVRRGDRLVVSGESALRADGALSAIVCFRRAGSPDVSAPKPSPADSRYFADGAGRTWIPIGCNICFDRNSVSSAKTRELYDGWMSKFAKNGGNFMRVWLSTPFLDVMPDRAGEFSEEATDNLKWLVGRAGALGLKLKFTFENFRNLGPKDDADPEKGIISFKKAAYASHAKTMRDVFTSPECFDIYLAKARHVAEAVGASEALVAVELWNEINSVSGFDTAAVGEWSGKMLAELKRLFPGRMTLQNLGSFSAPSAFAIYDWMAGLAGNDFMQMHRYLDPGAEQDVCRGPMDVLCADAIRELLDRRQDCPAILAETGAVKANHAGPSELYARDLHGMLLHDELFAPFFAGSAGCGQPWHWDHQYIDGNNLWWHFARFAEAVKGVDPAAERFRPFHTETRRLRVYGLRGVSTTLLWCRDKANTWESELVRGEAPATISGEKLPFTGAFDCYLPWEDRHVKSDSAGVLPDFARSIVVRVSHLRY